MTDVQVAEPAEAAPEPQEVDVIQVTDDESAYQRVADLLNPQVETTTYDTQTGNNETPDAPEQPEEAAPEGAPSDEAEDAQTAESEPEEQPAEQESAEQGEEFPNTTKELAELLSVDHSDLISNLAVEVEGQEVTLAELARGHLREADYIRKTENLAEQRKAAEAERQQLQQQYQAYQQQADTLVTLLQSQIDMGPSDQELNRLLEDDPHEYMKQKTLAEGRQAAMQRALHAKAQQDQQTQAQMQQRVADFRQEQQRALVRELPELSEPAKVAEFEQTIGKVAKERYGFSPEEFQNFVNGAWDHRHILMLRDLAEYHKFKEGDSKLKKKVKKLPRVQRPGTAADKEQREADSKTAVLNRMRSRGDDASAMAFVSKLLR